MCKSVATSFYETTERASQDIRAMHNSNKFFCGILLQNKEQKELDKRVVRVLQQSAGYDVLLQIIRDVPYGLFVCKNFQENYEIYRSKRA